MDVTWVTGSTLYTEWPPSRLSRAPACTRVTVGWAGGVQPSKDQCSGHACCVTAGFQAAGPVQHRQVNRDLRGPGLPLAPGDIESAPKAGGGMQYAARKAFQGQGACRAGTGPGSWQDSRTYATLPGGTCQCHSPAHSCPVEGHPPGDGPPWGSRPAAHTGETSGIPWDLPSHLQLSPLCSANASPRLPEPSTTSYDHLPSHVPPQKNLRVQTLSLCHWCPSPHLLRKDASSSCLDGWRGGGQPPRACLLGYTTPRHPPAPGSDPEGQSHPHPASGPALWLTHFSNLGFFPLYPLYVGETPTF